MKKIISILAMSAMVISLASPYALAAKKPNVESSETPEVKGVRMPESGATPTQKSNQKIKASSPTFSTPTTAAPSLVQQAAIAASSTLGPNLIQNSSVEASTSANLPANWNKGGYGTNSRTFTYPAPGFNSTDAIKVSISSYSSGDAKWYFDDAPVTPGATYQFSDYYNSNVSSSIDVRYAMNDGTYTYKEIVSSVSPSTNYQQIAAQFTVPQNVKSVTVFHLINQVGNLTTDQFSLNQVNASTPPPPPPPSGTSTNNLIQNSDFEQTGSNGLPVGWGKGGYGTNNRTFTYPVSGVNGGKAAQVSISNYSSGDAKWYFNPVSVSAGTYTYQDDYMANIPSTITVWYQNSDGSASYQDIASLPAQSSFTHMSIDFTIPSGVQAVSVFHLIEGVGSLTTDNTSLAASSGNNPPPSSNSVFDTGAVTLRFDDGWLSQYQVAFPKMQSAGYKGTFFIVTRQLADYNFSGFMSKAQVMDLHNAGDEIGAHTQTHADLPTLNSTQQQQEIQGSLNDLLAMGIPQIPSFAYPYGDYNSTTLSLVKSDGFSEAAATINGDVTPNSDRYQLERDSVESNVTIGQIQQWIDNAIANKEWLILTFHQIDTSGDQYSTTPTIFNQVVDYLKQKNARVVTIQEGSKYLP